MGNYLLCNMKNDYFGITCTSLVHVLFILYLSILWIVTLYPFINIVQTDFFYLKPPRFGVLFIIFGVNCFCRNWIYTQGFKGQLCKYLRCVTYNFIKKTYCQHYGYIWISLKCSCAVQECKKIGSSIMLLFVIIIKKFLVSLRQS